MANAALTYGGFYFSTPASTTLSAATPAKAAGTTTALPVNGFTHTASNKITYDGATTRTFMVQASVCFTTATAAPETCFIYLYKDGSLIPGADIERKVSTNDVGAALVTLATDEYVELYVETTGGDNLTIDSGSVTVRVAG